MVNLVTSSMNGVKTRGNGNITFYSQVSLHSAVQDIPTWHLNMSHAQSSETESQGLRRPHSKANIAWGGSLSLGFLNLSFSLRRTLSTSIGSVFPVNFCTPSSLQLKRKGRNINDLNKEKYKTVAVNKKPFWQILKYPTVSQCLHKHRLTHH